jgi:hypothetical protein
VLLRSFQDGEATQAPAVIRSPSERQQDFASDYVLAELQDLSGLRITSLPSRQRGGCPLRALGPESNR